MVKKEASAGRKIVSLETAMILTMALGICSQETPSFQRLSKGINGLQNCDL